MIEIELKELISEALCTGPNHAAYLTGRALAALYPGKHVLFGENYEFDISEFAKGGSCEIVAETALFNQLSTEWRGAGRKLRVRADNALFNVLWRNELVDVLYVSWDDGFCYTRHYWIISDSAAIAEELLKSVCEFCSEVRGEVLVFESGYWSKNRELFQSVRTASLDQIVLKRGLKREILSDASDFFASGATYVEYGVPWKRGLILVGPPGNGKTGTVKGLVNVLEKPCLYVKSFESRGWEPQESIRRVFERARRAAPCILVLEDLDSLVRERTRSFFLNEMDGFTCNNGLLVLATTNHPERLDPAILDRPSRFDRKFHFGLPGRPERREYLAIWNSSIKEPMRLSGRGLKEAARLTKGFSFAFLKELCMSSLTEWISCSGSRAMDDIARARAALLAKEMSQ